MMMMMENKNNFISLQEATTLCNYSQEYLSLRARHGKLKAIKIGRNWVTTKDWLNEYLARAGEYNNHLPPDNLPVGELPKIKLGLSLGRLRFAPLMLLVAVLIMASAVFGKESLKAVSGDLATAIGKTGSQQVMVGGISITLKEATGSTFSILKDYGQWLSGHFLAVGKKIKESPAGRNYAKLNGLIKQGLAGDFEKLTQYSRNLKLGYSSINRFLEEGISEDWQKLEKSTLAIAKGGHSLVQKALRALGQRGVSLTKEDLIEIEKEQTKTIIEKFQEELRGLKGREVLIREKETIKEIQKITEVQPVKEITKEVLKVDDEALKKVKDDISYLEGELAKRLYAPGGVVTQQIYIKEPVQSPKIYQENGEIVLQTLGSGNIIISAATGLQLFGQQIILDSSSILNPLIYLADKTKINGDLTVEGSISAGNLGVASINTSGDASFNGNASVAGNLTVSGDLTVSGAQNYSGAAVFTASSTSPALKVTQNGNGNIVQFWDGGANIFSIADGGYVTLATSPSATNPAFLFQTSDTTNWDNVTSTFLGINASSTFYGRFLDFQKDGTSLFSIASDGSLTANATITAASFSSGANDSTVRKSGEEVFREILPISRYDIPAQTGTTTVYLRVSKYFDQNPLSSVPQVLPGSSRVYKLIIKYTDDISANSSSSWRIYRPSAISTSDSFVLLGRNSSSMAEGAATTTNNLTIPDTDWQVEAKLSTADSGKTLRIFQIFLAAFDRIN